MPVTVVSTAAAETLDSDNAVSDRPDAARRPPGLLSAARLRALGARSDLQGGCYFLAHYALIGLTGWLLLASTGSAWVLPALLLHAVVLPYLFSPLHECAHGTAFRSRWLNEAALCVTALLYIVPPYWFRYFHLAHHRYTQIPGRDPEIPLREPAGTAAWLLYVSGLPLWRRNLARLLRHAAGRVDPADPLGVMHVPRNLYPRIVLAARVMLLVYALACGVAWQAGGLWLLAWLWLLPRLLGEPVQRVVRVAEHTGCAESPDLLRNTRTTLTHPLLCALAWQMPFHAEHHLFPGVPFHALPALHLAVRDRLQVVEADGYLRGQVRILRGLSRRARARATNRGGGEPAR